MFAPMRFVQTSLKSPICSSSAVWKAPRTASWSGCRWVPPTMVKRLSIFEREGLDGVDHRTTVVILGDGRNNYLEPRR